MLVFSDTSFIYLGFSNVAFDQLVGHLKIFYCFDINEQAKGSGHKFFQHQLWPGLPEGINRRNQPKTQEKEKTLLINKG